VRGRFTCSPVASATPTAAGAIPEPWPQESATDKPRRQATPPPARPPARRPRRDPPPPSPSPAAESAASEPIRTVHLYDPSASQGGMACRILLPPPLRPRPRILLPRILRPPPPPPVPSPPPPSPPAPSPPPHPSPLSSASKHQPHMEVRPAHHRRAALASCSRDRGPPSPTHRRGVVHRRSMCAWRLTSSTILLARP